MAQTATQRRPSQTKRRSASAKKSAVATKKKASLAKQNGSGNGSGTARKVAKAIKPDKPKMSTSVAAFAARKTIKMVVRAATRTGAAAIRAAADRTGELGREAVETALSRRLPIQVSVDGAVPLQV